MTVILEAAGVTKRFDGIAALRDVTVTVDAGELVALIGPNGAGKTTLFDCMSGVQEPDSGRITFVGTDLAGMAPHLRSRLGMARTFQRIELFPGLSVRDHLLVADRAQRLRGALLRDLLGRSRQTRDERRNCDAVLDLVGLGDLAERPVETLSLGQGRVVELARALVCRPRLLFLDEPSSGLDATEAGEMGDVLEGVRSGHETAIVLCEHDVVFVERLASRTYVLDAGIVIAQGPTDEVLASAAVRTAYLGHGV